MRLREKLRRLPRLLIVTAVEPERQAVLRGLGLGPGADPADEFSGGAPIVTVAAGVGPASAAAVTAHALAAAELADRPFTVAVSAGIAGGFATRAAIGDTVLAGRSIAADLGADSMDGFLSVDDLGFGSSIVESDPDHLAVLRVALPHAIVGDVLTVSTVTGTTAVVQALRARHPAAVAEAMEGFGVATAARLAGVAFAELRTISNLIGPRDRNAWRLADALSALESAAGLLPAAMLPAHHDGDHTGATPGPDGGTGG